jgi:hypothetical protein
VAAPSSPPSCSARATNKTITAPAGLIAPDGSVVPTSTGLRNPLFSRPTSRAPPKALHRRRRSWNLNMDSPPAVALAGQCARRRTCPDNAGFQVRTVITRRSGSTAAGCAGARRYRHHHLRRANERPADCDGDVRSVHSRGPARRRR